MAELTRVVEVSLRRLDSWLVGFQLRHPDVLVEPAEPGSDGASRWLLTAGDGERALVDVPVWLLEAVGERRLSGLLPPERRDSFDGPTFAVLMVRRAGYAVALFRGGQRLQAKVGTRHIHGRTAAGGWSQQRYARRRSNQADEIVAAAAASFAAMVEPQVSELGLFVTGGDRPLLAAARALVGESAHRSLGAALPALPHLHLGIGAPTAQVLAAMPDRALAVRIHLSDTPDPGGHDVPGPGGHHAPDSA